MNVETLHTVVLHEVHPELYIARVWSISAQSQVTVVYKLLMSLFPDVLQYMTDDILPIPHPADRLHPLPHSALARGGVFGSDADRAPVSAPDAAMASFSAFLRAYPSGLTYVMLS